MPIAHCLVSKNVFSTAADSAPLIALWAELAGVSSDEMTINLIQIDEQVGKPYDVMVTLYLPSLWPAPEIEKIQVGLAKALSQYFSLEPSRIHIITQILESGTVVENGEVIQW